MQLTTVQQNAIAVVAAIFTGIFLLLCCCKSRHSNQVRVRDLPHRDPDLTFIN